ncbi:hypothetical protein ACKWTF_014824 [Chironomus riparius]
MKTFVLIFTLSLICGSMSDDTGPLGKAFEDLTKSIKLVSHSISYDKYFNKIVLDCTEKALGLQNGQIIISERQTMILAIAAYVECLETNEDDRLGIGGMINSDKDELSGFHSATIQDNEPNSQGLGSNLGAGVGGRLDDREKFGGLSY